MSPTDADARPSTEFTAPAKVPPPMNCAECKALMRVMYYNLDDRPLCTKCSQIYRTKIERGTGPGAMTRAVLYGGGAALAGMVGLALLLTFVGAFRIIASIGVAYLVATAIGKATANYGGRRYQILAVSLTYVALGTAMLVPIFGALRDMSKMTAPPALEARSGPAGERAAIDDEMDALAAAPREDEDPAVTAARADSIAVADSVERLEEARAAVRARDGNAAAAEKLKGGTGALLVGALGLLLIAPIVSGFQYGLYAGVFTIMGLGYAMKKAWTMTDLITDYELSGPYKVGEGPIAPKYGGS